MTLSIDDFKGSFSGLARPCLYEVAMTGPAVQGISTDELKFRCKATQLPASTLGVIEVPYQGRKVKIPGDRTYAEWTVTLLVDNEFKLYKEFQAWSEKINSARTNVQTSNTIEELKCDGDIYMLDHKGQRIHSQKIVGCWVSEVGSLELAWDTTDSVAEVQVTFQFDYVTDVK